MNKNQLTALGMHQLLVIEFMKSNKNVTKKGVQDNVTINKAFEMEFETMMNEMVELNYVTQTVENSRKTYSLNETLFDVVVVQ